MASNQLRVNRTCNYCSCWGNLLLQTFVFDCNRAGAKETFGVDMFVEPCAFVA